jgi:uncharacterized protein YbjT (DUF2867 family)
MKILVAGAGGYIGTRLIPLLQQEGHEVIALSRSPERLKSQGVQIVTADLLNDFSLNQPIDAAYFLVHSMGTSASDFPKLEAKTAENFAKAVQKAGAKQIIFMSGLVSGKPLSCHFASRQRVEEILRASSVPLTVLRASLIIGSGSASFEIIRDLVEKLPIMIAPRWVMSKTQPIAIFDALDYLVKVLGHPSCLGKTFEIGGPDKLTYRDLLLEFAEVRGLKRWIFPVPFLSPRLSSLWLFFITSAPFSLARSLVDSLKNDSFVQDNQIQNLFHKTCYGYKEAVRRAFQKIEENAVLSRWDDSWTLSQLRPELSCYIEVPRFGCLIDETKRPLSNRKEVMDRLWKIGGQTGWLYMDSAWKIRGWIDRLLGGVGLRRGRRSETEIKPGDALDFWRVLLADSERGRLLLYAEMRLPGEAWLEFQVGEKELIQRATFRPSGLTGRLYWYLLLPIHKLIFKGMANRLVGADTPASFPSK